MLDYIHRIMLDNKYLHKLKNMMHARIVIPKLMDMAYHY